MEEQEQLISFEEAYLRALNKATINKQGEAVISLLLGNGFSMAYDSKRFSFTNLLESAKGNNIIPEGSNLLNLFNELKTSDFEFVIKTLESSVKVISTYLQEDTTAINKDIVDLKKHLVDVVTNNHPEKSIDISKKRSKNCSVFLNKFYKIYSLNYDLLTYWAIMQNGLEKKFTDGFSSKNEEERHVRFSEENHNLLFLHGALHLFDNKIETIKLTYSRTHETLKSQIQERLAKNIYPVFISEGSDSAKLEKIRHNYYLNRCYKSFRTQPGSLFIYGTVLKSNDKHIEDAIAEGKFKLIYIGVFSDEDIRYAKNFKERIEESGKKEVILYDAKTINPWEFVENETK